MSQITRRQFLRSAGGVTFLALTPIGSGLFAAAGTDLPKFTALPYIQPGNSSLLIDDRESIVVAWQTELKTAEFTFEYGATKSYGKKAQVTRSVRRQGTGDTNQCYNYAAELTSLKLSKQYYYRLASGGQTIAEGYFSTRKKRGEPVRFAAFGDNAHGDPGQRAIAYYTYQSKPDFIMNTGDNVYESGLDSEYIQYFYPIYNSDAADPAIGAPLLRSVPFYTVLANHDVPHKDALKNPAADFDEDPDSLGYYTAMHLPLNGPTAPTNPTAVLGNAGLINEFKTCAGDRFPTMANYSFDYGDVHFLCLDSNLYVDPTDAALQSWITSDLKGTDATWKIVVAHHPAFNVGHQHFKEQQFRVLCPLFESLGVDFVLYGHEHTYQRTMPLKFQPTDASKAPDVTPEDRRIPGAFTIDRSFDGKTNTKPNGIIHVTTGAGGKELYDPDFDNSPEKWLHKDDDNTAYVARFVSSAHSFTLFDVEASSLTMTQIDETGKEVDKIQVTKT